MQRVYTILTGASRHMNGAFDVIHNGASHKDERSQRSAAAQISPHDLSRMKPSIAQDSIFCPA